MKAAGKLDTLPILHGIPFSVKDSISLKGTKSSVGSDTHLLDEITEDADIIRVLIEYGAIPFVKTNIPVMVFSYHTSNHIFGTGENPWNRGRSVGGSSGGCAGLVSS